MEPAGSPIESRLNWIQHYAATEIVELGNEGRLGRREVLRLLGSICGGAAAGAAFLAACGGDDGDPAAATKSTSASDTSGETSNTTAAPATGTSTPAAIEPPLDGPAGHVLSVAVDDPDIRADDVEFDGPASAMFGYLAQPEAAGEYPGVIVIHEIFGLNDHIRDVARRLAKVGFVALAPDLASRAGGTDNADDVVGTLVGGPIEERIADLDASAAYLATVEGWSGTLGVVGFCFGGGMTLSYAGANPDVAAAVPYYGPTPDPASAMSATNAAILAHYGDLDDRVNAGIGALESAMAGKTFEIKMWDGAGHAFNNDTGANYDETAAVEAWRLTVAWFDEHLR
jgi:carboxymethylenebutenolidase